MDQQTLRATVLLGSARFASLIGQCSYDEKSGFHKAESLLELPHLLCPIVLGLFPLERISMQNKALNLNSLRS